MAAQARELDLPDGARQRRSHRRKLPFGRAAVLHVAGREHIVGIVDVSVGGAYLATRAVVPAGQPLCLRLLLPPGVELSLPCRVLRESDRRGESDSHPRGIAVRFEGVDAANQQLLERFIAEDERRTRRREEPA
jgi:PilZ domain